MQKTYYPKKSEIGKQEWVLIDANDQYLGRLASRIAAMLLGKHKPTFTPGVNNGDFVVVVNVERIAASGTKMLNKMYYRHSGHPGGLKEITLGDLLKTHPDRALRFAVWGMLPHNKLGRQLIKKVKIYAGPNHPHEAQQPKRLD
ncbi:MAG: 50S ribosomal protein L13 [Chloroflexota bacterium]